MYNTCTHSVQCTHKLEAVFTELLSEQESAKDSKPSTPAQHLLHLLHIHHPKDKDELVEHKVPELVTHVLGKEGGGMSEGGKEEGRGEGGSEGRSERGEREGWEE